MNEKYIIIGMNKGKNNGYYAMWCNDGVIYDGENPEGAIKNLLDNRYPGIWYINDVEENLITVKIKGMKIDGEEKFIGTHPKYIDKINKEAIWFGRCNKCRGIIE